VVQGVSDPGPSQPLEEELLDDEVLLKEYYSKEELLEEDPVDELLLRWEATARPRAIIEELLLPGNERSMHGFTANCLTTFVYVLLSGVDWEI